MAAGVAKVKNIGAWPGPDTPKCSKRPIHLADNCEMIEAQVLSLACHHVRRVQEARRVRRMGHRDGWVSID